jgi:hypothetical protein
MESADVCVDTIGIGSGVYDRLVELKKEVDSSGNPKIATFVQLVAVNVAEKAPLRSVQVDHTFSRAQLFSRQPHRSRRREATGSRLFRHRLGRQ